MGVEGLDPVIHQQTRLQILVALYRNRRASFTDLRDGLGLTAGNLASHTGRLEDAGYVEGKRVLTRSGFEVQYLITADGVAAFEAYLGALRGLLGGAGLDDSVLPDKQSAGSSAIGPS